MRIIGFNFTKISSERFKSNLDNLKINTEVNIKDIKELKTDLFKTKDAILEVSFDYKIDYSPEIAKIEISGNVLVSIKEGEVKGILKQWKKKSISEDLRILVLNSVIRKASLKAIQTEDELNLPPHIPLPLIRKEK